MKDYMNMHAKSTTNQAHSQAPSHQTSTHSALNNQLSHQMHLNSLKSHLN